MVELVSPSDAGPQWAKALRQKMAEYIVNGARLGWLLFSEERALKILQAQPQANAPAPLEPQRLQLVLALDGGELLPGLRLELEQIWGA